MTRYNGTNVMMPRRGSNHPRRDPTQWRCRVNSFYQDSLFDIERVCVVCKQPRSESEFPKEHSNWCRFCHQHWHREYRKNYPERRRESDKRADEKRKANGSFQRYQKQYRERNRDLLRQKDRELYRSDPQVSKDRVARWRRDNPEKRRLYDRLREQRKRFAEGCVTDREWQLILQAANHKCLRCGSTGSLTMDHVVPLSKGGLHKAENIQPLCRSCNAKKGVQAIDYR